MPWEHCGRQLKDDQDCTECGISKASWTINVEHTRVFQLSARRSGKKTKDHWLEVVLRDGEGQPLAGAPYQVELPSGVVKRGELDDEGKARVDGLFPGACKVRFPEHARAARVEGKAGDEGAPPDARAPAARPGGRRPKGPPAGLAKLGARRKGPPGGLLALKAKGPAADDDWQPCVTDDTHVFQLPGPTVKADLPLHLSFRTLRQATRWLRGNSIQVHVDGRPVPCGVNAQDPLRVRVQFRLPLGQHRVVVSAVDGGSPDGKLKPRRKIFLSGRLSVAKTA